MALFKSDNQSDWLNQLNSNIVDNNIDYFFTQRKVNEFVDVLDEKTLDRKTQKVCSIFNFLAINLPTHLFKNSHNLLIDVEIWGDNMFNFKGTINKQDGEIPHIMIKLKEDKNIFVKLIFKENDKILKTYISFIPVTKRFQHVNDNQTIVSNND
jgi:hypothetical protein